MGVPLYVICHFSLFAFNILSLSLIFVSLITVCLGVVLLGFILPGTLRFLDLDDYFLSHIREGNNLPSPGSTESPRQDKLKEEHTKIHSNHWNHYLI